MKLFLALALFAAGPAQARECAWQPAWVSSQMTPADDAAAPAGLLSDATLRQVVRLSTGGARVRVRVSNAFGKVPLHVTAASIARSPDNMRAKVDASSMKALRFAGRSGIVVPPGADWLSDPLSWRAVPLGDVAISLHFAEAPEGQTSHPGSRATSFVAKGDRVAASDLPQATPIDHWYQLSGVEVERCDAPGAIVALGDSITDGYGVKPGRNERWTDFLSQRLRGRRAVLNQGIGGNRVLLDGTGPNAMARLERDVLSQSGVSHLILLEGVNDIGMLTRDAPATADAHRAMVAQVTGAYAQIVARARARGIKVIGGTILPFRSNGYYHPDDATEADRQAINTWIRTPGHFDAVIDFDRTMRDPKRPDHLNPTYDSGDGLHPSPAGYRAMAEAVPLSLFD